MGIVHPLTSSGILIFHMSATSFIKNVIYSALRILQSGVLIKGTLGEGAYLHVANRREVNAS